MKKYQIITIGCQMNKSDSERIRSYLNEHGLDETTDIQSADLAVINTCGVRQSAEDRNYGLIPGIRRSNPKIRIVLTGCLSERADVIEKLADKVDLYLPIRELPGLDKKLGLLASSRDYESDYLHLKPAYSSKIKAYIPIGNGCDNFCSYCVVPYARGREKYRDFKKIITEAEDLVKNGYKELTFIAQNVNSYHSGKMDFTDLLEAVNDLEGDFWIRFVTSHPKDMRKGLVEAVASLKKVVKHIHLPVQSGDDEILKKMNRKYSTRDYMKIISYIRSKVSGVSLSTDIIVGFPGETKKQFNNTAKLLKSIKYDMVYIAQYSPRPGTAAFVLKDDIAKDEKKSREKILTEILKKITLKLNKKYIGKSVRVLVEGKDRKGRFIGYTGTNKPVIINTAIDELKSGDFTEVKITEAKEFGLAGQVCN